jgi:hypothetical protein
MNLRLALLAADMVPERTKDDMMNMVRESSGPCDLVPCQMSQEANEDNEYCHEGTQPQGVLGSCRYPRAVLISRGVSRNQVGLNWVQLSSIKKSLSSGGEESPGKSWIEC